MELRRGARLARFSRAYNYHEIRTPIFEATELFSRGVGEETDIVSKEMFTWEDNGRAASEKTQSLTLRPENTAGVVRAYIEHDLRRSGTAAEALLHRAAVPPRAPAEGPLSPVLPDRCRDASDRPRRAASCRIRDAEMLEMLTALLDAVGLKDWTLHLNSVGCAELIARSTTRPCARRWPG